MVMMMPTGKLAHLNFFTVFAFHDDDDDDDEDDEYNVVSAGLGHMCPNPQNGFFQCF